MGNEMYSAKHIAQKHLLPSYEKKKGKYKMTRSTVQCGWFIKVVFQYFISWTCFGRIDHLQKDTINI
jgi:hypothetical protein